MDNKKVLDTQAKAAWIKLIKFNDTLSSYEKEVLTHTIAESPRFKSKLEAYNNVNR